MKLLINAILLFLTSCATQTRVHDVTITRLPQTKEPSNLHPGVVCELSPASEASWIYLSISKKIVVTWSVYPNAAIPIFTVPENGWETQLTKDCEEWSAASAQVNGFPDSVQHVSSFTNNGVRAPIFRWSADNEQRVAFITSVRIKDSNLRAQLQAEAADGYAHTISIEEATKVFEELTSSDPWQKLYK